VRRKAAIFSAWGRESGWASWKRAIFSTAASSVGVAERSGQLLDELVPRIRKTADLVQEVSAASAEQSSGVAQINRAMSQVDQVTQRNASAAEELASTAEEMAAQAEGLQQLVSHFRLAGDAGRGRPFPLPAVTTPRPCGPTGAGRGATPRRLPSHSAGQHDDRLQGVLRRRRWPLNRRS
jgi:methyl-accepting chemotaxis protein